METWFTRRGLPLVVRITPLTVTAGAVLEEDGFVRESPTLVMVASPGSSDTPRGVEVAASPSAEWLEAQALLQPVSAQLRPSWEAIIRRIEHPAAFALIRREGLVVAAGLAVAAAPWVGLFEINVAPDHRRRGMGRALSTALLAWARDAGAERAYLQVLADNDPAIGLYGKLGFETAYRYWYLRGT